MVLVDSNVVSQLVTVTYDGSSYQVVGSSAGNMGSFTTSITNKAFPTTGSEQFALSATVSSPQPGDSANFATIAASGDTFVQKNLQFAALSSGFNNNRSKIEIAAGAGFHAVGVSTAPTTITMLPSGGTYYTFVDSGAFTVQYASFTYMDESGVQLYGNMAGAGPWSINNTGFDYPGSGQSSSSTLLSLNSLANSSITLVGVTYSSTSGNAYNYNYNILGSSTGLQWTNLLYTGTLIGAANTEDDPTSQYIIWQMGNFCQTVNSQANGLWSSPGTWDGGFVPAACNPVNIVVGTTVTVDTGGSIASTTTIIGQLSFSRVANSSLTIVGGNVNVNPGGTLDMGTQSSPINASSATLVLAYGSTAGQYGLIISSTGGNGSFSVYGAAKTPMTSGTNHGGGDITPTSTQVDVVDATGWQNGDTVTIDTEPVTISGISGNTFNITPVTLTHSAANTIYISNLSRNVLIESSGTVVSGGGGNSAYIRNLVQNTTNFNVNYGEFAYLGTPASGEYGITFDGTGVTGSISSSTIRNGYNGIYLNKAVNSTFTADLVYAQNSDGVDDISGSGNTYLASRIYANSGNGLNSQSQNNTITGNFVFWNTGTNNLTLSGSGNMISSNTLFGTTIGIWVQGSKHILNSNSVSGSSSYGIYVNATNITLLTNRIFNNTGFGLYLAGANGSTLISNLCYTNGSGGSNFGVEIYGGSNILAVANQIYSNLNGFYTFNTSSMTLVSNRIYSNSNYGLYFGIIRGKSFGTVVSEDQLGFNGSGGSSPDSTAEVRFNGNSKDHVVFRHVKINPANAQISTGGGFEYPSNYLVSYNQDNGVGADTGTVRIFGDYVVSGSTFAMDYSSQVYTSTNTLPKLMFGTGHSITSVTTFDGATLSELITVTYQGGDSWQVAGSSSGVLGTVTCAAGATGCSFANGKLDLTLNAGGTTNVGDKLDFATLAASNDANVQKKIYFGQAYNSPNYNRSKIEIASGGAFEAIGVSTAPTLMTMLGGSTYYTFVDSGAFTVQYASVTDMDENGLQLNGTGPFSINDSTVDFVANGPVSPVSTLFTLNGVQQSTIAVNDVTFGNSQTNGTNYNFTLAGTNTGLSWMMTNYNGDLTGHANELNDPGNQILWQSSNTCQAMQNLPTGQAGVGTGLWSSSANWNTGFIPTACNAVTIVAESTVTLDIPDAVASTTTLDGTLQFGRSGDNEFTLVGGSMSVNAGGTLDMGTQASPISQGTTAYLILAYGQAAGQYGLLINPGGNFLVYGAAKTPWTTATGDIPSGGTAVAVNDDTGWVVGDQIVIDTETVTITALAGSNVTFTPPVGQAYFSTTPIHVGDLSRTVVVRSSGTDTSMNTSYVHSLAGNTTSFAVSYGDFQYLGDSVSGGDPSLSLKGIVLGYGGDAKGSISSSTIRNGFSGIEPEFSGGMTFSGNVLLNNVTAYQDYYASLDTFSGNLVIGLLGNEGRSIVCWQGSQDLYSNNVVIQPGSYTNAIFLFGCNNSTVIANTVYKGQQVLGLIAAAYSSGIVISENKVYQNAGGLMQVAISVRRRPIERHSGQFQYGLRQFQYGRHFCRQCL